MDTGDEGRVSGTVKRHVTYVTSFIPGHAASVINTGGQNTANVQL